MAGYEYAIFPRSSTTPLSNRPPNLKTHIARKPVTGSGAIDHSHKAVNPQEFEPSSRPRAASSFSLWNPANSSRPTPVFTSPRNPPPPPPSPPKISRRDPPVAQRHTPSPKKRRSPRPLSSGGISKGRIRKETARAISPRRPHPPPRPDISKPLPPPPPTEAPTLAAISASRPPVVPPSSSQTLARKSPLAPAAITGKRRRGLSVTSPKMTSSATTAALPPLDPPRLPSSTLRNEDSMSEMSMKLPLQQPSPSHDKALTPSSTNQPRSAGGTTVVTPAESAFPIQLPSAHNSPPPQSDLEKGVAPPQQRSRPSTSPSSTTGPDEEIPWGPQHPCFPHPNPHVPLSSALYTNTRIVRIPRDWLVAGDLAPTFSNVYPQILDPLFPETEFRRVVAGVNERLVAAFKPSAWRNVVDAVMGVLTGWVWDDVGLCAAKGKVREAERFLEDWNRNVGRKEGVEVVGLRRTGFLSLDVQIPVPVVEEVVVGGPEGQAA